MTREEAIERIKMILEEATANEDAVSYVTSYDAEALDIALKALSHPEKNVVAVVPCKDAISRQEVNKLQKYRYNCGDAAITCVSLNSINELPSVTLQPKMGHWIKNEWGNISCSSCGCTALYDKVYPGESVFGKAIRIKSTFCPTCGAKM